MNGTVLLVDDDPISVHLLEIIIERLGYTPLIANSGAAALQMAAQALPNAIIVDDMMPTMSGGEMCRILKDDPHLQHIPVVLISAGTRVQNNSYIKKVGADYALVKPILSRDVFKVLNQLIRSS
jgi:two-component system cell cycle response regulator